MSKKSIFDWNERGFLMIICYCVLIIYKIYTHSESLNLKSLDNTFKQKIQEENKQYCKRIGVEFIDCDYDADNWYSRMKGMEYDPERGQRCTECFDMRMERTALYAHEHGFHAIATTNSTSRWKDMKQVDESGYRCAARYEGLKYWSYNWQSDEMTLRKYQVCTV